MVGICSLVFLYLGYILKKAPLDPLPLIEEIQLDLDIPCGEIQGTSIKAPNSTEFERSYQLLREKIKKFKARNIDYI